jgi:large subunit ribosomal protein L21
MYAVIRAGGKQYRVAPGDIVRLEKQAGAEGTLEFELLAVGDNGMISRPQGEARVVGQIMEEGRGKKVLVFHYKRKKQYKKLAGHRQPFTAVRIAEITYDGQTVKAPELQPPVRKPKATEASASDEAPATERKGRTRKTSSGSASTGRSSKRKASTKGRKGSKGGK